MQLYSLFYPSKDQDQYWLSRFVFLRMLGLVYVFAFFSIWWQLPGLIGSKGILPASLYLNKLTTLPQFSTWQQSIGHLPTIFWLNSSDEFMTMSAFVAIFVSLMVCIGYTNGFLLSCLWLLYFSFVQVGQNFLSFGWDILLCETGLLAIFISPFFHVNSFHKNAPTPKLSVFLMRFLAFRVMLGAGLIKLNAHESCWVDFSCLEYHYETQPIPNPLSWWLHQLPKEFHYLGVLINHFIELIVPFFLLGTRKWRHWAATLSILFQGLLILSGNLSFLNWLTITTCLLCYDDSLYKGFLPVKWKESYNKFLLSYHNSRPPSILKGKHILLLGFFALNIALAYHPIHNLLPTQSSAKAFFQSLFNTSPAFIAHLPKRQIMNTSFNPLFLMNTYGAFGSVGKVRKEIVIYGTTDDILDAETKWHEYEFHYKPSNPFSHPPIIAPYQPRLDWQIWFAAMGNYSQYPWFIAFIYRLLENEKTVIDLIKYPPDEKPKYIKADLFVYEFTSYKDEGDQWWRRKKVGSYLPPISLDNPSLKHFLYTRGYRLKERE